MYLSLVQSGQVEICGYESGHRLVLVINYLLILLVLFLFINVLYIQVLSRSVPKDFSPVRIPKSQVYDTGDNHKGVAKGRSVEKVVKGKQTRTCRTRRNPTPRKQCPKPTDVSRFKEKSEYLYH